MDDDMVARKRAERAQRKAAAAAAAATSTPATAEAPPLAPETAIRRRAWLPLPHVAATTRRVRVVSWNMLAQCLVRRELFPGSDCLKFKTRLPGLAADFTTYDWDIGCFQEVDSMNEIGPILTKAGYAFEYQRGYATKRHGLVVAWRAQASDRPSFDSPVWTHVLHLDDAEAWGGAVEGTALSRITRNTALMVALPCADGQGGVVVVTTHLFWQPRYEYERVRQVAAITQAINAVRTSHEAWSSWPVIFAGDLNDQPHSSTYTVLTGQGPMYKDVIEATLQSSRIVHTSVDEARGHRTVHYAKTMTEDGDEDRVLGRFRYGLDNELLTTDDLLRHCKVQGAPSKPWHFQSVYGTHYGALDGQPGVEYFKVCHI